MQCAVYLKSTEHQDESDSSSMVVLISTSFSDTKGAMDIYLLATCLCLARQLAGAELNLTPIIFAEKKICLMKGVVTKKLMHCFLISSKHFLSSYPAACLYPTPTHLLHTPCPNVCEKTLYSCGCGNGENEVAYVIRPGVLR